MCRTVLVTCFVLVGGCLCPAGADTISLDPASLTSAGVDPPGFGLMENDNIDALSYGDDPVGNATQVVLFSVDRVAIGEDGTAVADEAQPGVESAAGDIFRSSGDMMNQVFRQETVFGLADGFFGDDIDGYNFPDGSGPLYFSIDALSEFNNFGFGGLANDIFFGDVGTVFAEGVADIGLEFDDDIDGLALWDQVNPGYLDPGEDFAYFSLSTFSPNTFTSGFGGTYSPGDVLYTDFTGAFELRFSAASLGLLSDDNIDALDVAGPGEIVPEPTSLTLLLVGMMGLALVCRKRSVSQ